MTSVAGFARRIGYALIVLSALLGTVPLAVPTAVAQVVDPGFRPYWVQNHEETELWSASDGGAQSFGTVPAFSYFQVLQAQRGTRLNVINPRTMGVAWIDAKAVGPSGEPPPGYAISPSSSVPSPAAAASIPPRQSTAAASTSPSQSSGSANAPPVAAAAAAKPSLPARIVSGANVRERPELAEGNLVGKLGHNSPVTVVEEVNGGDGEPWYRIADAQFVHSSLVRMPRPFPAHPGRLIEADLSEPVMVTAYEDGRPVYSALALKGTMAWGTPTGFFTIRRRVQSETMDSRTLGIPNDAPGGYLLKNVLFTQYFTDDGASIHYNYWSGNFGYSGSHGCLGMSLEDAQFFWEWAGVGTPLIIRE